MALDTTKLRRRLPQPPTNGSAAMEEPADPGTAQRVRRLRPEAADGGGGEALTDGRSLRATGRVVQLNLKTSPETKARFLALAKRRRMLMVDLFEEAIAALESQEQG